MSNVPLRNTNAKKSIAPLNRNILFTGLTSFLTDTSVKMVYSVMPMFLLSIGASRTALSLIEGIAESTSSLLKSFSGYWSDKMGKNKPLMLLGYGLSALIMPLYVFVVNPLQVLFLRFIERVGKGIRTSPRDSLIAGSSPAAETGKSFGFQKAMDNSGAIVGPLLAFLILWLFPGNYKLIFLLAAIPSLAGIAVIIFGIRETKNKRALKTVSVSWKNFPSKFYFFLGIIFVFTLGNSTDALLIVKARETGITVAFVPLVYMVTNVVSVLFSIPTGILADKIGKEKVLIAGYLVYAGVYFGFGKTGSISGIVLLFALYGLYSALTDGVQKALVADMIPKESKGTGLGIYNALLGFTLLPASLVAGILYDKVNSSLPFYLGAFMAVSAAILMAIYLLKMKKLSNSE